MQYTATYSPDDNKLRLTASARLDPETYERVRAMGFIWAPKQEQFIAAMWTPGRADLCIRLAGEIEDEDSTLAERAADRAERFDEYHGKRTAEAERAQEYVATIADGIPMGQPILVGHHSQRHAERDAKRIEDGMRRTVQLWDTAEYWKSRAAGALSHARYVETAEVRARRIKRLESELRGHEREVAQNSAAARMWGKVPRWEYDRQTEVALYIAGNSPVHLTARTREGERGSMYTELKAGRMHGDRAWRLAVEALERSNAHEQRWLEHYANRLAYERAMLGEQGGLKADAFDLQLGGTVLVGDKWLTIVRINRKDGRIVSLSTNGRGRMARGIEEVQNYRPPTEKTAAAVKSFTTLAPLCNYAHESFESMTKAEYAAIYHDYRGTIVLGQGAKGDTFRRVDVSQFEAYARHRVRSMLRGGCMRCVHLTDQKTTVPPTPPSDPTPRPRLPAPEMDAAAELRRLQARNERVAAATAERAPADAMRAALKAGVVAVAAPLLFLTPAAVAERMVDLARPEVGERILEPSAGTGALLAALAAVVPLGTGMTYAFEINGGLAAGLRHRFPDVNVSCGDFLEMDPRESPPFDLVLMNPPFGDAADIAHVRHALQFLRPGGRLVAIVAGGPRQAAALMPIADSWECLPSGTFAGTGVRSVLLTMTKGD